MGTSGVGALITAPVVGIVGGEVLPISKGDTGVGEGKLWLTGEVATSVWGSCGAGDIGIEGEMIVGSVKLERFSPWETGSVGLGVGNCSGSCSPKGLGTDEEVLLSIKLYLVCIIPDLCRIVRSQGKAG